MVPGIDLESSKAAIKLANQHPNGYASLGVYPHHADSLDDPAKGNLARMAASPNVVAIGEIGLDYYRNLSSKEAQQEAFEWQLDLAWELELPIVVHCRQAFDVASKNLLNGRRRQTRL